MKVISVEAAREQLPAICEEALSGEIIRFKSLTGAELELTPVFTPQQAVRLSNQELASCYDDSDWAAFENNCGKASE